MPYQPGVRRFFAARKVAPLPYDAEIEYLESTGTQYVDTGVIVNSTTAHTHRMVLDMAMVSTGGWRLNGSAYDGTDSLYVGFSNSNLLYYGNGHDWGTSIPSFYDRATFDLDTAGQRFLITKGDTVVLDTSTSSGVNYTSTGLHVWLFGYSGENVKCSCKIYSAKLYQSGILVRDYIPVRVGTEGCLYDRVTRRIFRNAGTGAFTIGPDKS